jgi:hypothetical protein
MGEQKETSGQDSLTPVTVKDISIDISLDEEAAAMNKGKGRMIISAIVVLAVIFVGAGMFLKRADKDAAYREAGQTINALKKRQFDRFWGCTLEGVDLRDINSNAVLTAKIESRSSAGALRYGKLVKDRCLEILDEIATNLDVIQVPGDLQTQINGMKKATSQLRDGWREYLSVITNQDHPYDEVRAHPYLEKIALGWYGFTKEHAGLNKVLEEKLR